MRHGYEKYLPCSPIIKYDKMFKEIQNHDEGDDMYCNHCGKKLSEDDFFCSNCGTRIERNDIWSGDDDGSFDETVLYNPKDTLDALAQEEDILEKKSDITPDFIEKAREYDVKYSNSSQNKGEKQPEWVLNETAKPLFKNPDAVSRAKSERKKEDFQLQASREQSARAAKRLQDRWKRSVNDAQSKTAQENNSNHITSANNVESKKSLRKLFGFSGKDVNEINEAKQTDVQSSTSNSVEKKGFFRKRVKPIVQKEEVNQSEELTHLKKENSLARLFIGIIFLGLVIGVILGLVIAKPWINEEEEAPENPIPLMVVMPYIDK